MSLAPSPSASRGTIILQPSYFTSSLYVEPLLQDVVHLTRIFAEQYVQTNFSQPFALFLALWQARGWPWLHFKVFDPRSRDSFLKVTARVFVERLSDRVAPFSRVVALFGLYTFFFTQPSCSTPPIHCIQNIPVPMDVYSSLFTLPTLLSTEYLSPLQPHITYILLKLMDSNVFQIAPLSTLNALNPRELPREKFIQDNDMVSAEGTGKADVRKKKGRPTKRDRAKKANDALASLEKWLDKTTYIPPQAANTPLDGAGDSTSDESTTSHPQITTHTLLSNPPTTSRNNYRNQKSALVNSMTSMASGPTEQIQGEEVLERANRAVLERMRKIDQMAAEKGLEVGGEGGERTGLARVEKAVSQMDRVCVTRRGGLLGLLEGGGMDMV